MRERQMGGYGFGRPAERITTEECLVLDVNRLRRSGFLKAPARGLWQWSRGGERVASINLRAEVSGVVLSFSCHGEAVDQSINLEGTPCHFGGSRPWFACPQCGRRCAKLYLPAGGWYFLCRHCYGLGYESRREHAHYRAMRRARKLWARLGAHDGDVVPFKPKGMHWTTYLRLVDEAEAAEMAADAGFAAHLLQRHAGHRRSDMRQL